MVYEIVELEEKQIVGVSERVRKDETEVEKIKKLWEKFVEETQNIREWVSLATYSVYFNYKNDGIFEYSTLIGYEVGNGTSPEYHLSMVVIPKGKYAKFTLKGNPKVEISKFWENFRENFEDKLNRSFEYDFEEHIPFQEENEIINIYISIKNFIAVEDII